MNTINKQLTLNNSIDEVTRLGDFIDSLAQELHIDAGVSFAINLALEEAVVNVINYAFPPNEHHSFLVNVHATPQQDITFQIIDDGIPFDPLNEAPPVDTSLGIEERPIGGLGIFLVQNTMDHVAYSRTDGKNILTIRKKLKAES